MPLLRTNGGSRRRENRLKIILGVAGSIFLVMLVVVIIINVIPESTNPSQPGLTIYPSSSHIKYNPNVLDNNNYVSELNDFIQAYETSPPNSVRCNDTISPGRSQTCMFEAAWLTTCSKENKWGYGNTTKGPLTPCILLTPNKVIDWVPDVYKSIEELPEDMPQDLKTRILSYSYEIGFLQMAYVSCEVLKGGGICSLTPWTGFPWYYFPYKNNPNYRSPVLAAQVTLTEPGREVEVEFKHWAKNTTPDNTTVRLVIEVDEQLN